MTSQNTTNRIAGCSCLFGGKSRDRTARFCHTSSMSELSPAESQAVTAPLSRAAIFLVMTIKPGEQGRAALRGICADQSGLVRTVGFRDVEAGLSCVMGIGSDAWDQFMDAPRPKELHPFREFHSGRRHAP